MSALRYGLHHEAVGWVEGVAYPEGGLATTDDAGRALRWRSVEAAGSYARAQLLGPAWRPRRLPE
jgi:hypothetical protein